jgi:zinc D-Ala-D-Ala dipeptidase
MSPRPLTAPAMANRPPLHRVGVLLTMATLLLAACATSGPDRNGRDLMDVQHVVPTVHLDIRYASADNFVGMPIRGYEAPKCLLLRPAAEALADVERELRRDGHALRVFDCYRPQRAVRHFVEWTRDSGDTRTKPRYYPNLDKSALLGEYIAETSGHSRGATIDLTLMRCDADRCTPLDMGTPFDFFDERAHTDSPLVSAAQRANRHRLRAAMARHGFRNYSSEWWHYTLVLDPAPVRAFDEPVR